ncbi:MAG: hypothetical protein GXO35_08985 [Gammaproteobacteria bacterium]|nr:hypothetical protein [Gammaproteobacteria bacterium]
MSTAKNLSPEQTAQPSPSNTSTGLPKALLAPLNKTTCDEPAYLFWKMQSQLVKLSHRLRLQRLKQQLKTHKNRLTDIE